VAARSLRREPEVTHRRVRWKDRKLADFLNQEEEKSRRESPLLKHQRSERKYISKQELLAGRAVKQGRGIGILVLGQKTEQSKKGQSLKKSVPEQSGSGNIYLGMLQKRT